MIHVPMTSCRRGGLTPLPGLLGSRVEGPSGEKDGNGARAADFVVFSHRDLVDLVGFHRGFTWIGDSPWDKMGISMGRIGRISSLHDFRMGQNQAPKRVDE